MFSAAVDHRHSGLRTEKVQAAGFAPGIDGGFHASAEKCHPVEVAGEVGESESGLTVELIIGIAVKIHRQSRTGKHDLFAEDLRGIPLSGCQVVIFFAVAVGSPFGHRS